MNQQTLNRRHKTVGATLLNPCHLRWHSMAGGCSCRCCWISMVLCSDWSSKGSALANAEIIDYESDCKNVSMQSLFPQPVCMWRFCCGPIFPRCLHLFATTAFARRSQTSNSLTYTTVARATTWECQWSQSCSHGRLHGHFHAADLFLEEKCWLYKVTRQPVSSSTRLKSRISQIWQAMRYLTAKVLWNSSSHK